MSGIGFLVDMGLALGLYEYAGLALWLAATISFFTVAGLNYLLFEFWIFRAPNGALSWRRLGGVLMASIVAASTRIGTILGLSTPLAALITDNRSLSLALLVSGGAVSVVVNFALNRTLVFARKP
ncbi:MAG: GtrA family protein [Hyphomicrobiales bacterium]